MMGMTNEIETNAYHSLNDCEPSHALLMQTSSQENLALNASLVSQLNPQLNAQSQHWTAIDGVNIDMSSIINGDLNEQTILLMPSAMDLMGNASAVDLRKASTVQMVITSLPIITTATPVNVIQVPTNILLADNLIVIPQESITIEVPTIDICDTTSTNLSALAISSPIPQESDAIDGDESHSKKWYNDTNVVARGLTLLNSQHVDQMAVIALQDCINDDNSSNDISLSYSSSGEDQTQLFEGNQLMALINNESSDGDINAFLESTYSSTVEEECDPLEAKQWLNDSVIAYRAMLAFNKTMSSMPSSPNSIQTS